VIQGLTDSYNKPKIPFFLPLFDKAEPLQLVDQVVEILEKIWVKNSAPLPQYFSFFFYIIVKAVP
jgi:hypothetical protein